MVHHHKDERYRSFVHHEQLDDEYLKLLTYSNAMMEGNRVTISPPCTRVDQTNLVLLHLGLESGCESAQGRCNAMVPAGNVIPRSLR